MRTLFAVCLMILCWLQYGVWFGPSGYFAQARLQGQVDHQTDRVSILSQRNRILEGEVIALKSDKSVLESRARKDLGLIKSGEVFYLTPGS